MLALALVLLAGILLRNGGHFSYTLDAPYTQMAMAEQITRGTYGINPGEPSSPSSSIIYPFLLALLSFLPLGQFSALLVCLAATLAAAVLMYAVAEEIGLEVDRLTTLQLAAITATLTLAFNLVGLAFAGLEHSLHVTLTVISLLGLLRFVRTKQADWWWLAAITLLPLLRFEAAAALAADMLVLIAFGKWRHAAVIGAVGVVLVGGFMGFLHMLGLPWLPSSVLHRSEVASTGIGMGDSGALGFIKAVYGAYRGNLMAYGGTHIALLIVLGLWGLARGPVPSRFGERAWAKPAAVGFFIVVALAQLTGGSLSSFSRYEIYVLALGFCAVLVAWQPEINAGAAAAGCAALRRLLPGHAVPVLRLCLPHRRCGGRGGECARSAVPDAPLRQRPLAPALCRQPPGLCNYRCPTTCSTFRAWPMRKPARAAAARAGWSGWRRSTMSAWPCCTTSRRRCRRPAGSRSPS